MNLGGFRTRLGRQFSVDNPTIDDLLNERYSQAVTRALWRPLDLAVDVTVASQSLYDLTDVPADVRVVYTGTRAAPTVYDPVGADELLILRDPCRDAQLSGPGKGVFTIVGDSSGDRQLDLYPTPDTAGIAIVAVVAQRPDLLTDPSDEPSIPYEMHPGLLAGVRADAYRMPEGGERYDLADAAEREFELMVARLDGRRKSLVGSGPRRARVSVGGR